jgi:short-subunit dehydrogenase
VALLGRDPDRLEGAVASARAVSPGGQVVGVLWDATDARRAGPALDEAALALGQIDLLVYVAGLLIGGGDPNRRGEAAAEMMDVNALGAIRLIEHAADYMVVAGRGRIAAVGSIAGDRGRKGNPAYGASKAALDAYLEGLRHRLHGTGVGVSTVKPGFVKTRMLPKEQRAFPPAITADDAARRIARGLERGRDVFYVPGWWRLVSCALRATPRPLFKRIAPP